VAEAKRISDKGKRRIEKKFRIPVDGFNPRKQWIISLDSSSQAPTKRELRQLVSFREFAVKNYYNERWIKKILAMPLPSCEGCSTTVFLKGGESAWFYRQIQWNTNPDYQPDSNNPNYRPLSLVALMDHIKKTFAGVASPEWEDWKKNRPKIFG
jgi:hypothetical protein